MPIRMILALAITLFVTACEEEDCTVGETTSCTCAPGVVGTSTCQAGGITGVCSCSAPTDGGGVDSGEPDTGPGEDAGPRCDSASISTEPVNGRSSDRGMWTQAETLCPGDRHRYGLGVGCGGGGPACGTCTVSAALTYENSASDIGLQIYLNNGEVLRDESRDSSSPKTASARVEDGGSFSVRVNHEGGPSTPYSVDITYACD